MGSNTWWGVAANCLGGLVSAPLRWRGGGKAKSPGGGFGKSKKFSSPPKAAKLFFLSSCVFFGQKVPEKGYISAKCPNKR